MPDNPQTNPPGFRPCLYFFNGALAMLDRSTDADFHRHHGLQISISLDRPFLLETRDRGRAECRSFIIDSDIPHRFDSQGSPHLILIMDPEHETVRRIRETLLKGRAVVLDLAGLAPGIQNLVDRMAGLADCGSVRACMDSLGPALSGRPAQAPDPRIQQVLDHISGLGEKKISTLSLAALVNLSESRFAHLFKAHTGVPVRRYLLWHRLMHALHIAGSTFDLTRAAHQAGFADSAHLSRTFKQMFGSTPSDYFKKPARSRFVQFFDCRG